MAGDFLVTLAWICPFLYLSSTLASILNGLGKTTLVFFQNTFCLLVRILFVVLLIPRHGILAYLWGLLASLLLQTFIELMVLRSYMKAPFHAVRPLYAAYLHLPMKKLLFRDVFQPKSQSLFLPRN